MLHAMMWMRARVRVPDGDIIHDRYHFRPQWLAATVSLRTRPTDDALWRLRIPRWYREPYDAYVLPRRLCVVYLNLQTWMRLGLGS